MKVKESPSSPLGSVTIIKVKKSTPVTEAFIATLIESKKKFENLVTNESAELFAGYLAGDNNYRFTHIYGQWGEPATYPENGGPFFTPQRSDTITNLDSGNISTVDSRAPIIYRAVGTQPGQSLFANNMVNVIGVLSGNIGKSYVGAGLVCELPTNKKLLVAHTALNGIIMGSGYDLLIMWNWLFTNN